MKNNESLEQKTSPNQEPKKKKSSRSKLRSFFIFLIIVGIIGIIISSCLLIIEHQKYKNYISIAADFISSEKVYKNGISYNQPTYKYKVKGKEYFFKSNALYLNNPEKIIEVKYNPQNPNQIYHGEYSNSFLIALLVSMAFSFTSSMIAISLSGSKLEKIITVQVIEQVTCVGGRKIYLDNINMKKEEPDAIHRKYYVYFTDDLQKFAFGNKLTFNVYKYSEVLTTEKYRGIFAQVLYNFKKEDFTLIETYRK